MRFSTYMIINVVAFVAFALVLGVVVGTIAPTLGILFAAVFLLMGVPIMLVSFALLSKRLDDYGGRYPMPGFWGLLGVDLTDSDYDPSDDSPEDRRDGGGKVAGGVVYDNVTFGGSAPPEEPELDAYGTPISHVFHCAYCGALLPGPNVKFCSECGKPVVRTAPSENRGIVPP